MTIQATRTSRPLAVASADPAAPDLAALDPLRILHLLAPAPFGGLEQVVRALSAEQARSGQEVHVGAVLEPGAVEPAAIRGVRELGVRVHWIRRPHRRYLRERRMVGDLCDDLRPDVVHSHGYHADVLHGPVARQRGLATVSTAHGFIGGDWKGRLYERLQLRAYRRCDAVVGVSRPMIQRFEAAGVPADRVHCVPNAVMDDPTLMSREEARRALGLDPDAFVAGFIGRVSHEKGPDVFVDAVTGITDRRIEAVVMGDGRLRTELEERAKRRVPGRIRWAGVVDGAARLMKALDVVVLSSRTEGTPIVLLEAMAARVPVIATAVGGVPDVVTEREAVVVPPEDVTAIEGAILDVMDRPAEAAVRAAAARARLRAEFGAEAWVQRYQEVYRTCAVRTPGVTA